MFLCIHHKRMKPVPVPVLFEGMSILLGYSRLLWVDDSGSSHDDGSTFTRCRLGKNKKKGSYKVNDYRKSTLERSGVMQNSQLNPDKLERLK